MIRKETYFIELKGKCSRLKGFSSMLSLSSRSGLINELSLSIGFRYYCQFYAGAHYETETHAQLPGSKPGSQQYDT